jgi:hypothetical protein
MCSACIQISQSILCDPKGFNSIYFRVLTFYLGAGIARLVYRLATGWTVRGSNPCKDQIFRTCSYRHRGPMGSGSFPGIKQPGRGVDHPPHLAPRWKKEYSYPLLLLWAFMACSRVNISFSLTFYLLNTCNFAAHIYVLVFVIRFIPEFLKMAPWYRNN